MYKVPHQTLVNIGAHWLRTKAPNTYLKCQFVVKEFLCQGTNEIPDIFGLRPYGHVLVEVKVSKRDFKAEFKKRCWRDQQERLGNYRYFLTPKDLITTSDLPQGWGLLQWNGGKQIEVVKRADRFEEGFHQANYVYHSILRRLHKSQVFKFNK